MSNSVRNYLKNYCKDQEISPRALERKAGTGIDSIYEFLVGRRNDIKLSTAVKIADTLSVSLDELVDRKTFLEKFTPADKHKGKVNQVVLGEIFDFILSFLQNSRQEYSFREVVYSINEIYDYTINNNLLSLDTKFAEWFCANQMHKL